MYIYIYKNMYMYMCTVYTLIFHCFYIYIYISACINRFYTYARKKSTAAAVRPLGRGRTRWVPSWPTDRRHWTPARRGGDVTGKACGLGQGRRCRSPINTYGWDHVGCKVVMLMVRQYIKYIFNIVGITSRNVYWSGVM